MRIDRLLLDRAGGSERRAVTQHRPQPQRVLDVIKEPNLQGEARFWSESAGVSSTSNSSVPRHARHQGHHGHQGHQGHQTLVYRGMRVIKVIKVIKFIKVIKLKCTEACAFTLSTIVRCTK